MIRIFLVLLTLLPAFQQSRVERAINFLRDDIVDASHTTPPLIPPQVVSYTLNWHRIAIETVNTAQVGWEKIIIKQLDSFISDLGPSYKEIVQPDIDFIKVFLK